MGFQEYRKKKAFPNVTEIPQHLVENCYFEEMSITYGKAIEIFEISIKFRSEWHYFQKMLKKLFLRVEILPIPP